MAETLAAKVARRRVAGRSLAWVALAAPVARARKEIGRSLLATDRSDPVARQLVATGVAASGPVTTIVTTARVSSGQWDRAPAASTVLRTPARCARW